MQSADAKEYLRATEFIESDAPEIVALAASLCRVTCRETAVALFEWVRDRIRYDVRAAMGGSLCSDGSDAGNPAPLRKYGLNAYNTTGGLAMKIVETDLREFSERQRVFVDWDAVDDEN